MVAILEYSVGEGRGFDGLGIGVWWVINFSVVTFGGGGVYF